MDPKKPPHYRAHEQSPPHLPGLGFGSINFKWKADYKYSYALFVKVGLSRQWGQNQWIYSIQGAGRWESWWEGLVVSVEGHGKKSLPEGLATVASKLICFCAMILLVIFSWLTDPSAQQSA